MSLQSTITSAITAIDKIDPTQINDRIAAIEADKAKWSAAIDKAQDQLSAVARQISNFNGPDGQAAGEALLEGDDVVTAARGLELLTAERDALRSGIRDLQLRIEQADKGIYEIRENFGNQVRLCLIPIADELRNQAKAQAELLYAIYASADAINDVTRCHVNLNVRMQLSKAIKGLAAYGSVAPCERITVPDEIQSLLSGLNRLGAAFPVRVPQSVTVPW